MSGARSTARLAAGVLGAVLVSLSALATFDRVGLAVSLGTSLALLVAVALARWPAVRGASTVAIALYVASLAVATVVVGVGAWPDAAERARVQLFTGNPNVLGAALVTAFTAWAAVAERRRLVWWGWPLVAFAVLLTGSRTAGAALLAAGAVWLVLRFVRGRRMLVLAPLAAVALLALAAFVWQRGVVEMTPNLLASPNDLRDRAWNHSLAASFSVVDDAAPGPFDDTRAQRLVGTATSERRHIVHQSTGRSDLDVPYVASLWLRADEPQQVVLTSHLARVTCDVGPEWRRCVTPVGYGNDDSSRQLHLRAVDRGGSVDLYVFGAQYERGVVATPFDDSRPGWLPQTMVNRFDLRRLSLLPEYRVIPMAAGLEIAREHPWFGLGLAASREAFLERTAGGRSRPVTYAHNLAVQLLAAYGVVGLVGFCAVVLALLTAVRSPGLARLAPLLVALAVLNTWDVTLFEATVFPAAVLAVALWTRAPRGVGTAQPATGASATGASATG